MSAKPKLQVVIPRTAFIIPKNFVETNQDAIARFLYSIIKDEATKDKFIKYILSDLFLKEKVSNLDLTFNTIDNYKSIGDINDYNEEFFGNEYFKQSTSDIEEKVS